MCTQIPPFDFKANPILDVMSKNNKFLLTLRKDYSGNILELAAQSFTFEGIYRTIDKILILEAKINYWNSTLSNAAQIKKHIIKNLINEPSVKDLKNIKANNYAREFDQAFNATKLPGRPNVDREGYTMDQYYKFIDLKERELKDKVGRAQFRT